MPNYKLSSEGYVIRDGDTKISIGDSPEYPNDNEDYLDYLAWLAAGNTPTPADPTPPIPPTEVSMRQARLALLGAGLLSTVNSAIAAMTGAEGEAARIEWEYATSVNRNSPLVSGLTGALSLTSDQLDQLFTVASTF
jgi:hypothetical protein